MWNEAQKENPDFKSIDTQTGEKILTIPLTGTVISMTPEPTVQASPQRSQSIEMSR